MNFWDSANEGVNSGIKLGVKYAKKNKKKREENQFSQEEENENALMSQANDQVQRENAKLGADTNLYEEEEEEPKKQKSGLNPSTAYKIYQKYAGNGSSAMAGRSEGMIEMTPAESAAAGGESGGMGGLGSVLAIIYGADQIKKQFGGYNRKESELKLDENSHYYWTKPEINEIPWEEKTTTQKLTDAPASIGGVAFMTPFGAMAGNDTAVGKGYKEMARIEKQVFSPISKIISWLGLDVNQEGQEE